MPSRTVLLSILMIVGGVLAQAPEVRNIRSAQEGEVVTITYDLRGAEEQTYRVRLMLSTDGGETYDVAPRPSPAL